MHSKKNKTSGFTILELLIATTVFTVILLIATTGIIRIGNLYYKGITSARTQDVARTITSEITTDLQFASGSKILGSSPNIFCVGDKRYTSNFDVVYRTGQGVESTSGLYVATLPTDQTCNGGIALSGSGKQMLGNNMRLLKFNVFLTGSELWTVNIKVAYGDGDLLTHRNNNGTTVSTTEPAITNDRESAQCKSGIAGSNFCAVAQLDITVKKRLNND